MTLTAGPGRAGLGKWGGGWWLYHPGLSLVLPSGGSLSSRETDVDKQPRRGRERMDLKDLVCGESCPAPQLLAFPALVGRYLFHFIEENVEAQMVR